MRQPLTERYRERLAGVLSCYDRIIVTGTLPGACYAKGMTGFLKLPRFRGVLASLVDHASVGWTSIACS